MAADSMNTARRVPSRSRPKVAHAASLSRMASRRRPNRLGADGHHQRGDEHEDDDGEHELRPGVAQRHAEQLQRLDRDRAAAEHLDVDRPDAEVGRSKTQPVEEHRERGGGQGDVDAGQAQGGQRHERADQRADDARRTTHAHRVAAGAVVRHHTAPMPAKLSWHSEICPAKPTSGTSERATMPIEKILA